LWEEREKRAQDRVTPFEKKKKKKLIFEKDRRREGPKE